MQMKTLPIRAAIAFFCSMTTSAWAENVLPPAGMVASCGAPVNLEGAGTAALQLRAAAYDSGVVRLQEFKDPRSNAIFIPNASAGGNWRWADSGSSLPANIQSAYMAAFRGLLFACSQVTIKSQNTAKCQLSAASCTRFKGVPLETFSGIESGTVRAIRAPLQATADACNPKPFSQAFQDRSLAITDLSVVEDPSRTAGNGVWTFGFLMSQMAPPGVAPAHFVRNWLNDFDSVTSVNGNRVVPRSTVPLLNAWPRVPGTDNLDLTRSPFRLLAIVLRPDLRSAARAGEGRFIYGLVDARGTSQSFTVILEYNLPFQDGLDQAGWAAAIYSLNHQVLGTSGYNIALQRLTDLFSRRIAAPNSFVNSNPISQVRTNETVLGTGWELREFALSPTTKLLKQTTVKQTPDLAFNSDVSTAAFRPPDIRAADPVKVAKLVAWVNANRDSILAGSHVVPATLPDGTSLLGASAPSAQTGWLGLQTSIPENVRKAFSLNTCNGCHGRETNAGFTHVLLRSPGQRSALSSFMTGGDLARRANDLRNLITVGFCR